MKWKYDLQLILYKSCCYCKDLQLRLSKIFLYIFNQNFLKESKCIQKCWNLLFVCKTISLNRYCCDTKVTIEKQLEKNRTFIFAFNIIAFNFGFVWKKTNIWTKKYLMKCFNKLKSFNKTMQWSREWKEINIKHKTFL